MPCLIQCRDDTLLINTSNDTRADVLTGWVSNGEVLAEISEDCAEQTICVGDDNEDAVFVAVVCD